MTLCLKEMMTNVSDLVPSTSGSALKWGADTIVKLGLIFLASSLDSGRINILCANKLCQANSLITVNFKRESLSLPA